MCIRDSPDVVIILFPLNDNAAYSPNVPHFRPLYSEPNASAASSNTGIPYFPAISIISSNFPGIPYKCTGMIAFGNFPVFLNLSSIASSNLSLIHIFQNRAKEVLDNAIALLETIEHEGLFTALEKGIFGDVKRPKNGGKGLDGVTAKGTNYYNPFIELMLNNN